MQKARFLMKIILIILIISFKTSSAQANTGSPSLCGDYSVAGVIRLINHEVILVVNEKTKSEHRIHFPTLEQPKLTPYDDRPVTVKLRLQKIWNGTTGLAQIILERPELRVPNPLQPNDTGFSLISAQKCLK